MYNGDVLGIAASNGIDKTQLANTKSCDDRRDALDSSISVCGIASVQLVAITDPIEPSLRNIVERYLYQSAHYTEASISNGITKLKSPGTPCTPRTPTS